MNTPARNTRELLASNPQLRHTADAGHLCPKTTAQAHSAGPSVISREVTR